MEKKKHRKVKKALLILADWIYAAVNGEVQSHGRALLER